ncbi:general transcription factor IIIC, polypeptide 3, putative, partial [Eimeria necatrix]
PPRSSFERVFNSLSICRVAAEEAYHHLRLSRFCVPLYLRCLAILGGPQGPLEGPLGAPEGPPGALLGAPGGPQGPPEGPPGAPGGPPESPEGPPEALEGPLGALGGPLGALGGPLGALGETAEDLGGPWGPPKDPTLRQEWMQLRMCTAFNLYSLWASQGALPQARKVANAYLLWD